jgi:hypothetical protein
MYASLGARGVKKSFRIDNIGKVLETDSLRNISDRAKRFGKCSVAISMDLLKY